MRQQIEGAKHKLFQRMLVRVKAVMEQQYPEAGHALSKIQRAHELMFLTDDGIAKGSSGVHSGDGEAKADSMSTGLNGPIGAAYVPPAPLSSAGTSGRTSDVSVEMPFGSFNSANFTLGKVVSPSAVTIPGNPPMYKSPSSLALEPSVSTPLALPDHSPALQSAPSFILRPPPAPVAVNDSRTPSSSSYMTTAVGLQSPGMGPLHGDFDGMGTAVGNNLMRERAPSDGSETPNAANAIQKQNSFADTVKLKMESCVPCCHAYVGLSAMVP